jgi:hypothetical protein
MNKIALTRSHEKFFSGVIKLVLAKMSKAPPPLPTQHVIPCLGLKSSLVRVDPICPIRLGTFKDNFHDPVKK